jgi:lipopolysaccharide heptosyltransferase I
LAIFCRAFHFTHAMKFLIVRLSAMGDIVHTLPLAANLFRAGHSVSWLIESSFAGLLEGNPSLGRIFEADSHRMRRAPLSQTTRRTLQTLREELTAEHFDAVLDTMGSAKAFFFGRLASAPIWVLDDRRRRRDIVRLLADARVVPPASARHVVDITLSMLAPFGIPVVEPGPDAGYLLKETDRTRRLAGTLPEHFALYHPGAGWANKAWAPERFAEAALRIRAETGLEPVVSWGPGDEAVAQHLADLVPAPRIPLLGFAELAAVMARARLFVAGDTGPLHLADAIGVPTAALFGPTDPERNGPYRGRRGVVNLHLSCSPCWRRYNEQKPCLAGISAAQLTASARAVLDSIHRRIPDH